MFARRKTATGFVSSDNGLTIRAGQSTFQGKLIQLVYQRIFTIFTRQTQSIMAQDKAKIISSPLLKTQAKSTGRAIHWIPGEAGYGELKSLESIVEHLNIVSRRILSFGFDPGQPWQSKFETHDSFVRTAASNVE